jgi:uncharacterized membrane protein YeaQ/YmgE (transglycosylase-associated protein family)
MNLLLWIALGAFAAWLARRIMGLRDGLEGLFAVVAGALAAATLGLMTGGAGPIDEAALFRVVTVFVGGMGIFVMASLSTGGRLR